MDVWSKKIFWHRFLNHIFIFVVSKGEKMSKLSIVIINHNRELSIKQCIKNVLSQKEEGDEVIVVDDNSTDNSKFIIEQYKDGINEILSINSYGNRAYTRNIGAEYAHNNIIVFVDSDVIIGPNNLELVRKSFKDNKVVALNGNVFGNNHDVEQFEFSSNISMDEFINMVNQDFSILHDYPSYFDHRYNNESISNNRNIWNDFYTSFAAIRRKEFIEVGRFDEQFQTWGAEDIDLAYRLGQQGDVIFCQDIVSFHCPHYKNYYVNFSNDVKNLYYMLNKYRNLDIETLCSFFSDVKEVKRVLIKMFKYIELSNYTENIELKDEELFVGFSTSEYPNGYIKYKEKNKKEIQVLELFGLALPFKNKSFKKVYISDAYSGVPENVMCMIFQELIRISECVLLPKEKKKMKRYDDETEVFDNHSYFALVCYISQFLLDFEIKSYDDRYYKISWKPQAKIYLEKEI